MNAYYDGLGVRIEDDTWQPNPPGSPPYGKVKKLLLGSEFNKAWDDQKATKGQEPEDKEAKKGSSKKNKR